MSTQLTLSDVQDAPTLASTRTHGDSGSICTGTCEECGKPYTPENRRTAAEQRFCKPACRAKASRHRRQERIQAELEEQAKAYGQDKALGKYHVEACFSAFMALRLAKVAGWFTASDLRKFCEYKGLRFDWTKNWVGGVFSRSPWFTSDGSTVKAYHPGSRARRVLRYELSEEGKAVAAQVPRAVRRFES